MAVYALYVPTAERGVSGIRMERFDSRELAGRVLKERNATKHSKTFYLGDPEVSRYERPEADFPLADGTGYMRVFLRRAADPAPGLRDVPDEEWFLREGGRRGVLVREPWTVGREKIRVDYRLGTVQIVPGPRVRETSPAKLHRHVLRCGDTSCSQVFEAMVTDVRMLQRVSREHGWKVRGSVTGYHYYCARHGN